MSIVLLYCSHVSAETQSALDQTYVFFPFVHSEIRPNIDGNHDLDTFEVEAGNDLVYLVNYKNYRALTEIFMTNEEVELERLQIGIDISPDDTLWIGRFHSPLGYWSSNYHHGAHLQTSVHRPGIIEFEDDGGVLANLITGVLLDGQNLTSTGAINYSVAFGQAPTLNDSLEPYTFSSSNNRLYTIFKIGFQPDETNPTETGYVFSHSTISGDDDVVDYIQQNFFGMYSHQSWESTRITSSVFMVKNEIHYLRASKEDASFAAGYIHVEFDMAPKWITYTRFERSYGNENNLYLSLFGQHETERNLAGVRYDLTRRQAISSEISQRIADDGNHTHISIQWSAVFP